MKSIVIILLVASSTAFCAQFTPPEVVTAHSASGQFIVHSPVKSSPTITLDPIPTENLLTLEPSFVVVSCERIKQALLSELGVSSRWNGKIFIEVHQANATDEPVTVVCNRFKNGWNYQLHMPQMVERRRFMRAIVQALLLELANRSADRRSAEIPAWLSEGLVQQLLQSHGAELLLSPPRKAVGGILVDRTVTQRRQADPLEETRQTLREHPQITLEQLSWPTELQLAGKDAGVYCVSAQLFVAELLRLKDGPACMNGMLAELPRCYNWQTAFLRAFKPHFTRLLDLEKWWALQVVHLTGRNLAQFWTLEESRRKFDEILLTSAQVRPTANELPIRVELNLQTVIAQWDFTRQKRTLEEKVRSLGFLRLRLAPELSALADEYRKTLDDYLKQRAKTAVTLSRLPRPTINGLLQETIKQLDVLDEKRLAMKPQPAQAAVQ